MMSVLAELLSILNIKNATPPPRKPLPPHLHYAMKNRSGSGKVQAGWRSLDEEQQKNYESEVWQQEIDYKYELDKYKKEKRKNVCNELNRCKHSDQVREIMRESNNSGWAGHSNMFPLDEEYLERRSVVMNTRERGVSNGYDTFSNWLESSKVCNKIFAKNNNNGGNNDNNNSNNNNNIY